MSPMTPLHRQVISGPWRRARPAWQLRLWQLAQGATFLAVLVVISGVTLRILPQPDVPHMSLSLANAEVQAQPSMTSAILLIADVPDPAQDPGNWFSGVLTAIQSSDWRYLAAAILVGLVWAIRVLGGKRWPALATPRGSAILVMVSAFTLAFANALCAKVGGGYAPLDLHFVLGAAMTALTASGIWSWSKNLIAPPKPPAPSGSKESP